MNKKGFTLVELIITITLMVMIGLVVGTNMVGLLSREQDKNYEEFKTQLEEAACMYVETALTTTERSNCKASGCTVTVDQMIEKGLIEDDLKDPSTDEYITSNKDSYKVNVNWVNNEKTCTLNS